jgi:hypothetical protein
MAPLIFGLAVIISSFQSASAAFSSSLPSPWSPTSWQLTLSIGRGPGPDTSIYGGSSRLVLPFQVKITSDVSPEKDPSLRGNVAYLVCPESTATFINHEGLQTIEFEAGGWKLELPPGGGRRGLASKLRMWVVLKTDAKRNDISLAAGERIYLEANCWREEELDIGSRALQPFLAAYQRAQQRVEAQVAHDTGDRRLDGTEPLGTIAAFTDMAKLVADRDEKLRRLQKAEQVYPRDPETIVEGPWPGAIEWLAIAPTSMTIKRRKAFLDEFHMIGTWEAKPILNEDDYEEVEVGTRNGSR